MSNQCDDAYVATFKAMQAGDKRDARIMRSHIVRDGLGEPDATVRPWRIFRNEMLARELMS